MAEESQKALWGWRMQNLLIDHVWWSEGPGSRAFIPSSGGSGWDGERACLEDRMFLTCSGSLEPHLPFGLSCYCLVPTPLKLLWVVPHLPSPSLSGSWDTRAHSCTRPCRLLLPPEDGSSSKTTLRCPLPRESSLFLVAWASPL